MTNLLEETLEDMKSHGVTPAQITFIGSYDGEYWIDWGQFERIADVEYDSGYGAPEVATDLEIHFDNGVVFSRGEYDGSEWWDVHVPRTVTGKVNSKSIQRLVIRKGQIGWESVASIQGEQE